MDTDRSAVGSSAGLFGHRRRRRATDHGPLAPNTFVLWHNSFLWHSTKNCLGRRVSCLGNGVYCNVILAVGPPTVMNLAAMVYAAMVPSTIRVSWSAAPTTRYIYRNCNMLATCLWPCLHYRLLCKGLAIHPRLKLPQYMTHAIWHLAHVFVTVSLLRHFSFFSYNMPVRQCFYFNSCPPTHPCIELHVSWLSPCQRWRLTAPRPSCAHKTSTTPRRNSTLVQAPCLPKG